MFKDLGPLVIDAKNKGPIEQINESWTPWIANSSSGLGIVKTPFNFRPKILTFSYKILEIDKVKAKRVVKFESFDELVGGSVGKLEEDDDEAKILDFLELWELSFELEREMRWGVDTLVVCIYWDGEVELSLEKGRSIDILDVCICLGCEEWGDREV